MSSYLEEDFDHETAGEVLSEATKLKKRLSQGETILEADLRAQIKALQAQIKLASGQVSLGILHLFDNQLRFLLSRVDGTDNE